jgi:hypothetical protein
VGNRWRLAAGGRSGAASINEASYTERTLLKKEEWDDPKVEWRLTTRFGRSSSGSGGSGGGGGGGGGGALVGVGDGPKGQHTKRFSGTSEIEPLFDRNGAAAAAAAAAAPVAGHNKSHLTYWDACVNRIFWHNLLWSDNKPHLAYWDAYVNRIFWHSLLRSIYASWCSG